MASHYGPLPFFRGQRVAFSSAGLLTLRYALALCDHQVYRMTTEGLDARYPADFRPRQWVVRIERAVRRPPRDSRPSPARIAAYRHAYSLALPNMLGFASFPEHLLCRADTPLPGDGDTNDPLPGGWNSCTWRPEPDRSTP